MLASLIAISTIAGYLFWSQGLNLYYGDAEAHLNIARRLNDSITPGYEQIGTVWLPLLHVLLIPFVRIDSMWQSGLAGVFPSAISFVLAGLFLFFAARRSFDSTAAGAVAAFAFALNPNLLYLQSAPMTESLFFACQCGMIAAIVRFSQTSSMMAVVLAGIAGCLGSLTRYDGWFLLPFAALAILITGKEKRWRAAFVFCLIAGSGAVYWLIHNRWFYSNWLEFYNGPYSAKAIQGDVDYGGKNDWTKAIHYYWSAARACVGLPLILTGIVGLLGVIWKRAWWPLILFAATPVFYIASLHSGGTPIHVPELWPGGHYNTRYGLAVLPLAAFAAAGLIAIIPVKRTWVAVAVTAVTLSTWIAYPRWQNWITFQESVINSKARRAWTHETALFLKHEYKRGDGVYTTFSDVTGIYREAGIPLRETMHEGNGLTWIAALSRPDLFFWQKWAIAREGDAVSVAMRKKKIECVRIIRVAGAPAIEIFRNEHPLRESARRAK